MFQFSERHIEEYWTQGYTVLENVVPPSLINDLRRECDIGRDQVRLRDGRQAQRFHPGTTSDIDPKVFQDWCELPVVRDAIGRIIKMEHKSFGSEKLIVLIEPADEPWCTPWHRDWRDNIPGLPLQEWTNVFRDEDIFNQVNCALYEDSSTWVVPGSHARHDSEAEVARFPERPMRDLDLQGLTGAERERACLEYCQSLPNAKRLFLNAGDYCLYRNSLWHMGNYMPTKKRATLHDNIMTPAFQKWWDTMPDLAAKRRAEGFGMENPNANRIGVPA